MHLGTWGGVMRQLVTWRRSLRQLPVGSLLLGSLALAPAVLRASGETVPLNPVSLPPGATMTLTFDVDVDSPLGVCATAISNQGEVTGTGISVFTDDTALGGATDPTATPLDVVDLAITKTDGATTEVPGTGVTYTIVASNSGPVAAFGATVADTFPAALTGVSWTCVGAGGATCTAAGAGNIADLANIPAGGTVTYTVNASIAASATGNLVNTATVTKAANQVECNVGQQQRDRHRHPDPAGRPRDHQDRRRDGHQRR